MSFGKTNLSTHDSASVSPNNNNISIADANE